MKRIEPEHSTAIDELFDQGAEIEQEGRGRSTRKRAATAAQDLGLRLLGLSDADLAKLPLPEALLEALRAARKIRSRGGLARQHQYIGRLMRDVDPVPIEDALEGRSRAQALEAERFRRVEAWRDRLIAEGELALTALDEWTALPDSERAALIKVVQRARRSDSSPAQRATRARELFRALRTVIARSAQGQ